MLNVASRDQSPLLGPAGSALVILTTALLDSECLR